MRHRQSEINACPIGINRRGGQGDAVAKGRRCAVTRTLFSTGAPAPQHDAQPDHLEHNISNNSNIPLYCTTFVCKHPPWFTTLHQLDQHSQHCMILGKPSGKQTYAEGHTACHAEGGATLLHADGVPLPEDAPLFPSLNPMAETGSPGLSPAPVKHFPQQRHQTGRHSQHCTACGWTSLPEQ